MPLDLSALLKKTSVATSTEPPAEKPVESPVEVKTGPMPTKPKLAFQLGNRTVSAPVPEQAVNHIEEAAAENKEELQASDESMALSIRPAEPEVTEVKDFRTVMDELDSLFVEGTGYSAITIGVARQRVVTAMTELKSNPELIQLVKDTDLRNIMAFINHSADSARVEFAKKKETKEKKGKTTARRRTLDMSGFGDSIAAAAKERSTTPADLAGLAKLDLSQMKLPGK